MCGKKIIVLIIIIIFIVYLLSKKNKSSENFDYNSNCKDCNTKGYFQCRNCKECGVCTTEWGDMYCAAGDEYGPKTRKDCYKWDYGNIYPQYKKSYYEHNNNLLNSSKDGEDHRFYPFTKAIDEKNQSKTQFYSDDNKNGFYYLFNNTLKPELYKK
jgi:hypothetical protein